MHTVTLPIWLVFAYPAIALVAYLLLVKLLRKAGPSAFMKMMGDGRLDLPMAQFWERYGKDIIVQVMRVGGPILVDEISSRFTASMRGNAGAIKKQILKSEQAVGEYVQEAFAQSFPVLSRIGKGMGMKPPENAETATMFGTLLQPVEAMLQEKALSMMQDIGRANGLEMPEVSVQNDRVR